LILAFTIRTVSNLMHMKIFKYAAIATVLLCTKASIAQEKVKVNVAEEADAPIVSKHIYGHFAEHLGRCIYEGLYVGEE